MAVVENENNLSCSYFFRHLVSCNCGGEGSCQATGHAAFLAWLKRADMVIFSDRSMSFINAVSTWLPSAHHV
jgi:hypothetical protein